MDDCKIDINAESQDRIKAFSEHDIMNVYFISECTHFDFNIHTIFFESSNRKYLKIETLAECGALSWIELGEEPKRFLLDLCNERAKAWHLTDLSVDSINAYEDPNDHTFGQHDVIPIKLTFVSDNIERIITIKLHGLHN